MRAWNARTAGVNAMSAKLWAMGFKAERGSHQLDLGKSISTRVALPSTLVKMFRATIAITSTISLSGQAGGPRGLELGASHFAEVVVQRLRERDGAGRLQVRRSAAAVHGHFLVAQARHGADGRVRRDAVLAAVASATASAMRSCVALSTVKAAAAPYRPRKP